MAHVVKLKHDGKAFVIYALVCPLTSEIKYVGQTIDLEQRFRAHWQKRAGSGPLAEWLRSLGDVKPYRIILERGINRRVMLPARVSKRGWNIAPRATSLAICLEAKWIKRLRRSIVNKDSVGSTSSALLVNPPLPWELASGIGE
jgi:hypothetical protein